MCHENFVCQGPTVLKSCGDDFLRRRSNPSPVTGLHHHAILGEFFQVIQCINLTVPRGVNADDVELEISPSTVLPISYLVPTDNSILQVLLWSLNGKLKVSHLSAHIQSQAVHPKIFEKYTRLTFFFFFLPNASLFLGNKSKILPAHETATFFNRINFRCGFFFFKSVHSCAERPLNG